jgi:hypothetical protein
MPTALTVLSIADCFIDGEILVKQVQMAYCLLSSRRSVLVAHGNRMKIE